MHPQDLALVGLRMLAVYFGLLSIGSIAQLGTTLPTLAATAGLEQAFATTIMTVLVMLLPTLIAVALWLGAPRLAQLATRERVATETTEHLSAQELTRCGMIIVGVLVLVTALSNLARQLPILFNPEMGGSLIWPVSSAITVLLGVAVILGADRIASLTRRVRYAARD